MCNIDIAATTQVVTMLKDIALGVAALGSLFVAKSGLQTWKRQLRGTARFDAAKAHLQAAFQLRDAIWEARNPFIAAGEFGPGADDDDLDTRAESWWNVYAKRMAPVWEGVTALDTAAVMSEMFFGHQVRDASDEIKRLTFILWGAMKANVDNIRAGYEHFERDEAFGQKMRKVIAASKGSEDNPFSEELTAKVDRLVSQLKPHLHD